MQPNMPKTPFAMCLSGSAKETELRIRNIFQWKKKRPPVILFLLTAVLVLSCCGLVSCQAESTEQNDVPPRETDTADIDTELLRTTEVLSEQYDFDHDGTPEVTSLVTVSAPESAQAAWYELQIKAADGTLLRSEELHTPHAGWNTLFACTLDNKDYLLRYHPAMYQGICNYSYTLFSLDAKSETKELVRQSNDVEFNTNFGSMTATGFDAEAVADFIEEINELLTHCKLLFTTDDELETIDPENPQHIPGWLISDNSYWGYTYDETKTIRENIIVFEENINAAPRPEYYELHSLTLDEDGEGDDSIVLSIYKDGNGSSTGQADARILLGNGKTLAWNCTDDEIYCWGAALRAAYLTSVNHQCIVVEFPEFGSTYGAAQYYILEVVNGALKVTDLNDWELLDGFEIALRRDSELSCVRISVSVGTKWNSTGWGTLIWDNGQWSFTEDDYFIDKRTLTVDGGLELTLALRGRNDNYGSGGPLYYDQVQILHGETALQTITEDSFVPDNHCPFEYFNADAAFHAVLTEDINFDGNTDFGIPCNTTHNDGHVWFLYDPRTRQYRFAFSLAGIPSIDEENKQITEEWWDDSVYITRNTYEFNTDGQLSLIDSEII